MKRLSQVVGACVLSVVGVEAFGQAAGPMTQAMSTLQTQFLDEPDHAPAERVSPDGKLIAEVGSEIHALVRAMEGAIAKGDGEAYLALVDLSDPVFATEQRNWAKDLVSKPPSSITLTLLDASNGQGDLIMPKAGEAAREWRQTVEFAWSQSADSAGNAAFERTVRIEAIFRKVGEGAAAQWKYAGEAWERVEREHVIVLFDPGLEDAAHAAATVFERIRGRVLEGFNLGDSELARSKQVVKLYAGMAHLQQSIYLSYPHALGGWNEPGEAIKILANARTSEASLRGLLSHEYGHVCTFALGPKANSIPWWILEGVAELATTPFDAKAVARATATVRRWAKNDTLRAWSELTDFNTVPGELHGHVYTQGLHFVWWVSERFGRERRIAWLTGMAQGSSLQDATREHLGEGFDELDRQWRASLRQHIDDTERDEPLRGE